MTGLNSLILMLEVHRIINPGVMSIHRLDGLLTAVCTCPDPMPDDSWTKFVWSETGEEAMAPRFSAAEAEAARAMILGQLSATGERLASPPFIPLFGYDEVAGELLWQDWILGFNTALQASPDSWMNIPSGRWRCWPSGWFSSAGRSAPQHSPCAGSSPV